MVGKHGENALRCQSGVDRPNPIKLGVDAREEFILAGHSPHIVPRLELVVIGPAYQKRQLGAEMRSET